MQAKEMVLGLKDLIDEFKKTMKIEEKTQKRRGITRVLPMALPIILKP